MTALVGNRDELHPPAQHLSGVRYVCHADDLSRSSPGWHMEKLRHLWPLDMPRRASRGPKILSHLYSEAEITIWVDACAEPRCDPREFAAEVLRDADIAVVAHERGNLRTEQQYCLDHRVGDATAIAAQIDRYEREGFFGAPFVCGGIIVRRNSQAVVQFNRLWWHEYTEGQERDQFALAYALWKTGVRVRILRPGIDFPGTTIRDNPWFKWHPHFASSPKPGRPYGLPLRPVTA